MIIKNINFKRLAATAISILGILTLLITPGALAESDYSFAVTPMNQKIIITPGGSYQSSFKVVNPSNSSVDIDYEIKLSNFYVDENHSVVFEEVGDTGKILDWITIDSHKAGNLKPSESATIAFTVNVPEDAAAGGQYAAFVVTAEAASDENERQEQQDEGNRNMAIKEVKAISHLLYAEVAGNTLRQGEVLEASVPSFLLSGDISGNSSVKNTGNVHGTAKYTLQVFPLFSNEEIYTNEENPSEREILPDRTLYSESVWANTPAMGIFNVVYTVEFEGVTTQVKKMVIKCPVWLLFIIIFGIIAIIIWLFLMAKKRRTARRER